MRPGLLSFLFLAAASCAGRPPVERNSTGELQPLEPGLEWTYESDQGKIQTRRVVGTEKVGRFECRVVEARTGDLVERFWMRSDGEGLKLFRFFDGEHTVDFDDPLVLIPKQARPGATWSFEERHGPLTLAVEGRQDEENGRTRIRLVKRAAGRVVLDQTSWYAPDVGLVRMTVTAADDDGESRGSLVLKSCNFLPE